MKKKKKSALKSSRTKTTTRGHSHTVVTSGGGKTIGHSVSSGESWGIIDPDDELASEPSKAGPDSEKK